jgi:hemoglobin
VPLPTPAPGSVRGLVGRLGGPDRLREILTVFYDRLIEDSIVGFFFAGKDMPKVVAGQHAFLMRAFQETERFHGIHPSQAHLDLAPILRGHYDRRLVILRETLTAHSIHPDDIEAWLKVEQGMRRRIQKPTD